MLSNDEIAQGINSLNSKQIEVFSKVHTWGKDYVKYDWYNGEQAHIFFFFFLLTVETQVNPFGKSNI